MLRMIAGAYIVGAFLEFFTTFFILVFFAFRPGVGIIPGIKEAVAALAALIYYDLRTQTAQEGAESGQEGRLNDGD